MDAQLRRTSLKVGGGVALALAAAGAAYSIFQPQGAAPISGPVPVRMSASVFEGLASRGQDAAFASLSGPWRLSLPDDHGGHDEARIETWTLAAHLTSEEGDALGLQLSITRLGLIPPHALAEAHPSALTAAYRAHVILTDVGMDRVFGEERLSRGIGAAGHDLVAREVWHDNWLVAYGEGKARRSLRLDLTAQDVPIALELIPEKPAEQITQDQRLRAFAIPRLSVEGLVGGRVVRGTAILNRAWGDVPLPGGAVANDVLSIQLDDGSDLFLSRTTRRDGRGEAVVDGLASNTDASLTTLGDKAYALDLSPGNAGDAEAPHEAAWLISGPGLSLEAVPLLGEEHDHFTFAFSSGLLAVTGTRDGHAVKGLGSLQSTRGAR